MGMIIVPLELKELNALVSKWHRHHQPVQGHRFSLGLLDNGEYVGGCSVGRPTARLGGSPKQVLEVTRLVTNGKKNACSMLYSASARVGKEMGYSKIQTYILDSELGVSLKASGWICEDNNCGGGQWKHTDGKERRTDQPTCKKQRWAKMLNDFIAAPKLCDNDGLDVKLQDTMF